MDQVNALDLGNAALHVPVSLRQRFVRTLASGSAACRGKRHQPGGQNREGLATRRAQSASHPEPSALFIVSWTTPSAMPDDRKAAANGTLARQQSQWNYPGSRLSFPSGSAIKRIKVGVKALFAELSAKIRSANLSLHPPVQVSFERKKNIAFLGPRPIP